MPLDPELQAMLDRAAELPAPPLWQMPVGLVRAGFLAGVRACRGDDYSPPPLAEVSDRVVAGSVPVRIYRPDAAQAAAAPGGRLPAVAFAHAGGWVIGDLESHD